MKCTECKTEFKTWELMKSHFDIEHGFKPTKQTVNENNHVWVIEVNKEGITRKTHACKTDCILNQVSKRLTGNKGDKL